MQRKKKGYLRLRKIKRGKRIREVLPGRRRGRIGTVVKGVTSKSSGWFKIRWEGEKKASWAHANWFYTGSQLKKYGVTV